MGKALIFEGVNISNPLRTITFAPETAEEWVNKYADVVTTVSSAQKTALASFVDSLMTAGVWDSVRDFFPMLGGLNYYMKSLKRPNNAPDWAFGSTALSWDSTRNAPLLYVPGRSKGTELVYENDEALDGRNSTFIADYKHSIDDTFQAQIIANKFQYDDGTLPYSLGSYLCAFNEISGNERYKTPNWNGVSQKAKAGDAYNITKNSHNIVTLSNGADKRKIFCLAGNTMLTDIGEAEPKEAGMYRSSLAMNYYFAAERAAPAPSTFNGIFCALLIIDKALNTQEATLVSNALYTLDEALGRHVDFA